MAWLVCSCEEFCEESNRTAVVVHFYSSASDAIMPVKVNIKGIENDSMLDSHAQPTSAQVLLPINPTADMMSFSIQNDESPADTIIIHYSRHNGFISAQCGCVTYAEIQGEPERTNHSIMGMVVTNPNVTTVSYRQGVVNAENIRIYY